MSSIILTERHDRLLQADRRGQLTWHHSGPEDKIMFRKGLGRRELVRRAAAAGTGLIGLHRVAIPLEGLVPVFPVPNIVTRARHHDQRGVEIPPVTDTDY